MVIVERKQIQAGYQKTFAGNNFFLICLIQIVPLPSPILSALSENSLEIWRDNQSTLSALGFSAGNDVFTISLHPNVTWSETLLVLSYAAFGFAISRSFTTERKLKILLIPVYALAFFEATYGLYQFLTEKTTSAFPDVVSASGTFVNRNHFAGFWRCVSLLLSDTCWL